MESSSPFASIEPVVDILAGRDCAGALRRLNPDQWESVALTAIAVGLAPLLHHALQGAEIYLPPLTQAKLAVTHKAHAARNRVIAAQLAELLAAFNARQIPVLVLKGVYLAPSIYPHPALRPMNDIDLLFKPPDLPAVSPIFESLGYCGKHKSADSGPGVVKHLSTYRRAGSAAATPNPYLSAAADRMVEPHGSLAESWFGLHVDITPGVWSRAVPVTLHGQPAFRLSNADMLLHLAVHAVFHVIMGTSVFVQLYDVRQALAVWQDEFDWPLLLKLARAAQARPFLYAALYWAGQIFTAPVPPQPLETLRSHVPPALARHIHRLNARAIFARTQHPPLTTLAQRLRRGLADRRETARWAGSVVARWRVWQTALAFYKTDTAKLLQKRLAS